MPTSMPDFPSNAKQVHQVSRSVSLRNTKVLSNQSIIESNSQQFSTIFNYWVKISIVWNVCEIFVAI